MARPKLNPGTTIELTIDRLSAGGRGVGRHDGFVVFVPDTAPLDRIRARLTVVKKSHAEADLIEVLSPSPSRIEPACPVAGVCGGCNWQHLRYEEQLNQKHQIVESSLRKFTGFKNLLVNPVVPSPQPFRYRNRIQIKRAHGRLGFFERGTHKIVDIEDCLIADERLTQTFQKLRSLPTEVRTVELFLTPGGSVVSSEDRTAGSEFGFSQVNTAQNKILIEHVLKRMTEIEFESVFDLYAGNGNFTFPLAERFPDRPVTAVELSSVSVAQGQRRANEMGKPVTFIEAAVEEYLATGPQMGHSVALIDPPRTGCDPKTMSLLAELRPKHLFYISCHPVTLGRDLSLLPPESYEVIEVQPFDMFPQTDHVETFVSLRRI